MSINECRLTIEDLGSVNHFDNRKSVFLVRYSTLCSFFPDQTDKPLTRGTDHMTHHPNIRILFITLLLSIAAFSFASHAETPKDNAESFISQVRKDTEWFGSYQSRAVGQPGHDEAFDALYRHVRTIAGDHVWRHGVSFVVPQVLVATLTIHAGPETGKHRIYPFWPSGPRLNTTPAEGIEGDLIYVGRGTLEEFPARSLRDQIAVIEMTNGENWRNALAFGARAIIFLGSEGETHWDMRSHEMAIPLKIPRFYIPDGVLAGLLRDRTPGSGHIASRGAWREAGGQNIYALIPSRTPDRPQKAMVIVVQSDSMCMIPELAAGADAALDTALALNLMRRLKKSPAEHPVLFTFIDGFSLNMKGLRTMLGTLALPDADRRKGTVAFESLLETYRGYAENLEALRDDPQGLFKIHQPAYRDLHPFINDAAASAVKAVEDRLGTLRLAAHSLAGKDPEEHRRVKQEIAQLESRRLAYNVARKQILQGPGQSWADTLGSWVGMTDKRPTIEDGLMRIEDHVVGKARELWERAQERILGQVGDVEKVIEEDRHRKEIRDRVLGALNLPPETSVPLSFVVGLDLSDAGVVVGPNTSGRMIHNGLAVDAAEFLEWLMKTDWEEFGASLPRGTLRALATEPWLTIDAQDSFVVGETAMMTSQVASYGLPHMSWATLDAYRAKVDTPRDRVDLLDWERLLPQIHLTAELVRRLAGDKAFRPESETEAKLRTIEGRIVAHSPGDPMARFPETGYLASVIAGRVAEGVGRYDPFWSSYGRAGMRRQEFAFTGWDGRFYLRDMPTALSGWQMVEFAGTMSYASPDQVSLQAHRLAEDGSIVGTIDYASTDALTTFNTYLGTVGAKPLSGTVFPCKEMNAFHLYDPRVLMGMGGITIVDAYRGNAPKRLNLGLHDGIMSGLMAPDVRWQIIQRTGITTNRLMLLNTQDTILDPAVNIREAAIGFSMDRPPSRHSAHQGAYDMYMLNERRLADYRRSGITSEAIDKMHDRTKVLLAGIDKAIKADDGGSMFYAAAGALANELRAYTAVRDLGNDVVRAVVILLLLLMPFSFAMERLLFSSPHPYRQLANTAVIFALMTALLWSFHPAFRITSQPLVIIMAFGIILMSVMVISVIFFKFKSNIEEMKGELAESSGATTSRFGLVSTAVKLGLANMRKRKLRTGLTGATIILITFAMLCFTSASTYVGERDLLVERKNPPPFTGLLLRQPSQQNIPRRAELYLNNIIVNLGKQRAADPSLTVPVGADPGMEIAYRYWWLKQNVSRRQTWRIHVRFPETGRQVAMKAGLGLQGNEDRFTRIQRILPNWERFGELERTFEATQRGGCYLAQAAAAQLGATPGDILVIGGRSMELVGAYDPDLLRAATDMDGQNLLVLDFGALPFEEVYQNARNTMQTTAALSGRGLTQEDQLPRVPADQTVILPASMLKSFGKTNDTNLRSIAIRTAGTASAREVAAEVGQRLAFPAYYGSPETGVRILAFVPLIPQVPRSLLILLILAGLIVFNTMMSSIAERKNEIYIYTSMGLAPMHIGVLFLAEAVTYGLMGSIFGYIAGQALATALTHLGWLGGMSLNYSGTQAIATMAMVVGITIVSSIIPAYRAGRLAVPSSKMRWAVPAPVDGVIHDRLPFTVTDKTANATILYLHDYFDAHRDGAIGCFITDALSLVPVTVDNGAGPRGLAVMKLQATVSLAPYDLSVGQAVEIAVHATDSPEILELDISLAHDSGQVNNWIRLNKTFLGDLRRQLLGWRNLKARRILRYVAQAEEKLHSIR